ncbi:hypothetical protein BBF96_02090 [Anoxybacter fermentans]|uniref:Chemotaxis protein n=1 Tax=Anoxybacter fermentans TaxID=1323375 RepID=A0A3Q9HNW1_9FIRM|nr:methyl-accepting chemotaxis protein [Anoxybacter fermentans]AZR72289.1 hypothetical protein BBF96_02090 [Anoxybacter fermentans]
MDSKKQKIISFRVKLLIIFVIISLTSSLIVGLTNYFSSAKNEVNLLKRHAQFAIQVAKGAVNVDQVFFLKAGDEGKSIYKNLYYTLNTVRKQVGASKLYIISPANQNSGIIKIAFGENDYKSPIDTPFTYPENLRTLVHTAFQGETVITDKIYRNKEGQPLLTILTPLYTKSNELAGLLVLDFDATKTLVRQRQLISFMLLLTLISVVSSVTISLLLTNPMIKKIKLLVNKLNQVAMGNLKEKIELKSRDEFGLLANTINQMIDNLQKIIQQIYQSSNSVLESIQNISTSTEETSASMEEISSSIIEITNNYKTQDQKITQAVEEANQLTEIITQVSDNTHKMESTSKETIQLTKNGMKKINHLKNTSIGNANFANQVLNTVQTLEKKSSEINTIIETIQSIADQTNLLALNAAIEAARAGENGRGFMIVAEEIRNLAYQSANSAQQITDIVNQLRQGTVDAVQVMVKVQNILNRQRQLADETTEAFQQIESAIEEYNTQIQSVNQRVQELHQIQNQFTTLLKGIAEISNSTLKASNSISTASEESASTAEHLAVIAQKLAEQAEKMMKEIGQFKI